MEIVKKTHQAALLALLKDFSSNHTITSLAKLLNLTRVGTWKILKKLEKEDLISLKQIGNGKTSTYIIDLNWNNPLTEKTLSLYLTQEALTQKRWMFNFSDLESETKFVIIYGSILHAEKKANDIDILTLTESKRLKNINNIIQKIQKTQTKKIHAINFTKEELMHELKKPNKAFIDAFKKGVILYGQEILLNS